MFNYLAINDFVFISENEYLESTRLRMQALGRMPSVIHSYNRDNSIACSSHCNYESVCSNTKEWWESTKKLTLLCSGSVSGIGIGSHEVIHRGDVLGEYLGVELNAVPDRRDCVVSSEVKCGNQILRLILDGGYRGSIFKFTNTSILKENLNACLRGIFVDGVYRIFVVATKSIPVGSEIFLNYGQDYGPLRHRCGRQLSRGVRPIANRCIRCMIDDNTRRSDRTKVSTLCIDCGIHICGECFKDHIVDPLLDLSYSVANGRKRNFLSDDEFKLVHLG